MDSQGLSYFEAEPLDIMERLAEKFSSKAKTGKGGEQEGITVVGFVLPILSCCQ